MSIAIRRLDPADSGLEEIAHRLGEDFTAATLREFLADSDHVYLVARIGDDVVGGLLAYLLRHPDGHASLYVDEVDTLEAHRRRGVAAALMTEAGRLAGELGATDVWLVTEPGNVAAVGLYRSLDPDEDGLAVVFGFSTTRRPVSSPRSPRRAPRRTSRAGRR